MAEWLESRGFAVGSQESDLALSNAIAIDCIDEPEVYVEFPWAKTVA